MLRSLATAETDRLKTLSRSRCEVIHRGMIITSQNYKRTPGASLRADDKLEHRGRS